jgi:hypothetical protein
MLPCRREGWAARLHASQHPQSMPLQPCRACVAAPGGRCMLCSRCWHGRMAWGMHGVGGTCGGPWVHGRAHCQPLGTAGNYAAAQRDVQAHPPSTGSLPATTPASQVPAWAWIVHDWVNNSMGKRGRHGAQAPGPTVPATAALQHLQTPAAQGLLPPGAGQPAWPSWLPAGMLPGLARPCCAKGGSSRGTGGTGRRTVTHACSAAVCLRLSTARDTRSLGPATAPAPSQAFFHPYLGALALV